MDINTIAKNIRKYRIEKGYTQKELAEMIGRATITVSKYELGYTRPSPYSITVIAKVLGVNRADILRD